MNKNLFILTMILLLMVGFVSATQYEFVSNSLTNPYTGDANDTYIYQANSANLVRYTSNSFTGGYTVYATAGTMAKMSHYDYETTDDVYCFVLTGSLPDSIRCHVDNDAVDRTQALNMTDYIDGMFIGEYYYLYDNVNNKLIKYDPNYNNVANTINFVKSSTIFLNPTINGEAITYNRDDSKIYIYSNTDQILYKTDLTGSLLGSENVNSSRNVTDIYYFQDTWYFSVYDDDVVVQMSNTLPDGQFYYYEGQYYATQTCTDANTLCTNVVYYENDGELEYWCDIDDTVYCDAPCIDSVVDVNGQDVNTGFCGVATCSSECSFNGYKTCTSPTSYQQCGNYDADICLEYSPVTSCLDNQYCNYAGNCVDYNFSEVSLTSTTIALPSMYLKPTVSTDEGITTKKDTNGVYQISTEYNTYNQLAQVLSPLTSQTFYKAYVCDYQETILIPSTDYSENTTHTIEVNANDEITVTSFTIPMNGNNTINITIGNGVSNSVELNVIYDETTYNLLVYTQSTLLINDTGYESYDDLYDLQFIISNDPSTIKNSNLYLYVDRATPVEYQTIPIDYINDVSYLDFDITSTNNVSILDFNVYYVDERASYSSLTLGDDSELSCIYTSTGCYTMRSYVMGVDYNLYNNYEDIEVCVNTLGATPKLESGKSLSDELGSYNLVTRLFLMAFIIGIITIMFFVVGDNESVVKKTVGVGLIATAMILFIAVGLIPAWIIVIIFIIIAMFVTGFFQKMFNVGN